MARGHCLSLAVARTWGCGDLALSHAPSLLTRPPPALWLVKTHRPTLVRLAAGYRLPELPAARAGSTREGPRTPGPQRYVLPAAGGSRGGHAPFLSPRSSPARPACARCPGFDVSVCPPRGVIYSRIISSQRGPLALLDRVWILSPFPPAPGVKSVWKRAAGSSLNPLHQVPGLARRVSCSPPGRAGVHCL